MIPAAKVRLKGGNTREVRALRNFSGEINQFTFLNTRCASIVNVVLG